MPTPYRAPAGASPVAKEGGAEEMETVGTTYGPGDGGVGYGLSGGALYWVPAALAPPGTTKRSISKWKREVLP